MSFRKRFFAWMFKQGDSYNHRIYHDLKTPLFSQVRGRVVEIGPGSGVNFAYFPAGTYWTGIEPNVFFHPVLQAKAAEAGIHATLLTGDVSSIPLPDNFADTVLCTLVLCSVLSPSGALAEIKRVLKPGGKLVFIEHVAAPEHSGLRTAQNISNPLNRWMADGCNCNRETWKYIERAGFREVNLSQIRVEAAMVIHSPHILGYAIK